MLQISTRGVIDELLKPILIVDNPVFAARMTERGQYSFQQKSYSEIFRNICWKDY
jgi:hypothetical protein